MLQLPIHFIHCEKEKSDTNSNQVLYCSGWAPALPPISPHAAAYRAVGADLAAQSSDMAAKGDFLHGKLDETESLLRLENYYRDLAYGNSVTLQYYREQNADLFDAWEQTYHDKTYTLYTDSLSLDYALLSQLVSEYDTVAGYGDFLDSVQTKAGQLAGISIFQNDETGYDLKNIEVTAAVCAGLGETAIDYYPQKGLYTAISYAFTDLILLVSMLVQALLLVRQERDSGLLSLVRSLPGGRLQTALAKLGAFVMGLWVMLAALVARRAAAGWAAALAGPLVMFGIRAAIPATSRLNVIKYANLASLLQTNELLGNYRNLFWFGSPIGLPLVEWTAAVVYGGVLTFAFCWVFARATAVCVKARVPAGAAAQDARDLCL